MNDILCERERIAEVRYSCQDPGTAPVEVY